MSQFIYINDGFVKEEDAKVSVFDRGYLFGDGVFEGIRAYSGNVFMLKEHISRLFQSAKAILLDIPYTEEQVREIVTNTLKKNNHRTAYIRIIASRGVGAGFNLDPFVCKQPQFIVITQPFEAFSSELYKTGVEIVTVPSRRIRSDMLSPQIKSLNYLNNIMVKMESIQAGAKDGLMLNSEGYVTEATTQNIFIYKNGVLLTPPCYLGALEGITRNVVIEIAKSLGITVRESILTRYDIYTADEVFMTGTAAEIISVTHVDGRIIGQGKPGEIAKQLLEKFRLVVLENGVKF
ncbi:branched-chain-amino-acid transaminase [Paenibacillus sp. MER TA 81-3]|uniref:branched-chain-amino-acid transaminase n=1 Tax=Paenibacillus sp. MER TA 81-3 TaxID=2939573 RepID=UPI00203B2E84|nr:branched-chain-amino-acid transaminase [Paenibacillus sp. MER TA 81-3]MCM3340707.1 branched-chain-amino-acid transaminase [Paenibacillus sp. MER TA 81-3]